MCYIQPYRYNGIKYLALHCPIDSSNEDLAVNMLSELAEVKRINKNYIGISLENKKLVTDPIQYKDFIVSVDGTFYYKHKDDIFKNLPLNSLGICLLIKSEVSICNVKQIETSDLNVVQTIILSNSNLEVQVLEDYETVSFLNKNNERVFYRIPLNPNLLILEDRVKSTCIEILDLRFIYYAIFLEYVNNDKDFIKILKNTIFSLEEGNSKTVAYYERYTDINKLSWIFTPKENLNDKENDFTLLKFCTTPKLKLTDTIKIVTLTECDKFNTILKDISNYWYCYETTVEELLNIQDNKKIYCPLRYLDIHEISIIRSDM